MARRTSTASDGVSVEIARVLRRSNRRRVALSAVLLAVVAVWALADWRDIRNLVDGPQIVNGEELAADIGAGKGIGRWISITGEATVPRGLFRPRADTGDREALDPSRYALLRIGDQALLVRTGSGSTPTSQEGVVTGVTPAVAAEVVAPLTAQGLRVLPVVIDASHPYRTDVLTRTVSLSVFAVAAVGLFASGLLRAADHGRHPIVRSLAGLGDPQEAAFAVEDELSEPHTVVGPLRFTRSFVVRLTRADVAVARLDGVVFAYSRTRVWIPVLSVVLDALRPDRATVLLHDARGRCTKLRTRNGRAARQALEVLAERCPWVVVGPEFRHLWKRDQRRFVATVAKRRNAPDPHLAPDAALAPVTPLPPPPAPSRPLTSV